jgi:hypothetical protein
MAPLTAARRKALPASKFVFPGKRAYPIDTANRARNALSRVSQFGSSGEKATVRAKVHKKFPAIGRGEGARTNAMTRPGAREHGRVDWTYGGRSGKSMTVR